MPVCDRHWFEQRLADARTQKAQLLADYNAASGVEQFCERVISELLQEEEHAQRVRDAQGPQGRS